MPVKDFIITVYCCVADSYRELVTHPLRSRGFETKLSDEEVITMEIVGEFMGKDQDKSLWRYFRNHWHDWFPSRAATSAIRGVGSTLKVEHRVSKGMLNE